MDDDEYYGDTLYKKKGVFNKIADKLGLESVSAVANLVSKHNMREGYDNEYQEINPSLGFSLNGENLSVGYQKLLNSENKLGDGVWGEGVFSPHKYVQTGLGLYGGNNYSTKNGWMVTPYGVFYVGNKDGLQAYIKSTGNLGRTTGLADDVNAYGLRYTHKFDLFK